VRRVLAFIVDLVNVFSVLKAENDRSTVALDTGTVRQKRANFMYVIHTIYSPLRQKREIKQKTEHTDRYHSTQKLTYSITLKNLTIVNNIKKFSKHTTSINIAT